MAKKKESSFKTVAENRKASFNYSLLEFLEAGVVLTGSEVKSLRQNRCSISEAFVGEMSHGADAGSLFLFNANIPIYELARQFNHEPKRPRKILLHKKESNKWLGAIRKKGLTIVPLSLFFNPKGFIKIKMALAQGKNVGDKRETLKERDWNRDKARILKNYNAGK
ncbi:SsrA-binding protein [Alphaproteobacteria bacterium]|nr:SsrA-binding protein [Alphaproteobacteria bacterium]GHS95701.1 SsrA-binding protein [Alphaproteobacteria bacterium]